MCLHPFQHGHDRRVLYALVVGEHCSVRPRRVLPCDEEAVEQRLRLCEVLRKAHAFWSAERTNGSVIKRISEMVFDWKASENARCVCSHEGWEV